MGSHVVTRGQEAAAGNGCSAHHRFGGAGDRRAANETTISVPTELLGTKRKGQNKTHQDPHDKPTQ